MQEPVSGSIMFCFIIVGVGLHDVCMQVCAHVAGRGQLCELSFSFHLDVGSGDWIKVIRC